MQRSREKEIRILIYIYISKTRGSQQILSLITKEKIKNLLYL